MEKHRQEYFTVLLKHRPLIDEKAADLFDLQLSGHAHRGQTFPFHLLTALKYPHQNGLYPLPEGGWHPPWHGQLGAAHAHSGTAGNHFIRNCETEKNGKYALMAS
ncbi:MAG: hypothetical protein K8R55_07980 [Desulfuromonadaceae bacterium]|nr:hypothetical protein [Desulfuromonadaceae bacterium]